ncbi:MAG: glycerophosphodiester phosphodiesterase, partial [Acidimicrobiales bacterium]
GTTSGTTSGTTLCGTGETATGQAAPAPPRRMGHDAGMLILAHRGAHAPESPGIRENTLDAFRAAADRGADGVEFDVRRAADGVLVVHHDAAVPGGPPIASVRSADLPRWLPTLEEALDACAGLALVNVEIKNSPFEAGFDDRHGIAAAVAERLALGRRASELVVSSFNLATLDAVRVVAPEVATAWLTMPASDQRAAVATAAAAGHRAVNPPDPAVRADLVVAAHAAGLRLGVWTVNDADRMAVLAEWGVDVLISDRPALAATVLR